MNNIEFRKTCNEDILELKNLMEQYIVDFYKRPKPNEASLINLISDLVENSTLGLQFVAVKEGKLIGFATLYFTFSTLNVKRQAILNDLFVIPDARGQKVGEKLFETCLEYIRQNEFSSMTWETAKDNFIAQSLYKKMGGKLSEWLCYEIS